MIFNPCLLIFEDILHLLAVLSCFFWNHIVFWSAVAKVTDNHSTISFHVFDRNKRPLKPTAVCLQTSRSKQ